MASSLRTLGMLLGAAVVLAFLFLGARALNERYFSEPKRVCVEFDPTAFGIYNTCRRWVTR